MVLRPIFDSDPVPTSEFVAAWNAVEQQQRARANAWWLVTQPEHAALSGELASRFANPAFPRLTPEVVRAIARHDAGWRGFESDTHAVRLHADGRPVSFFEIQPADFLRAWSESIHAAETDSAVGGYIVSQHFTLLAEYRLRREEDPPEVQGHLAMFHQVECSRQAALRKAQAGSAGWDSFLPVLQFCDLLSLYICSGTQQPVEFPQEFAGRRVRAHFENRCYVLTPTPFAEEWSATVPARRYPGASDNKESFLRIAVK